MKLHVHLQPLPSAGVTPQPRLRSPGVRVSPEHRPLGLGTAALEVKRGTVSCRVPRIHLQVQCRILLQRHRHNWFLGAPGPQASKAAGDWDWARPLD